MNDDGDDDEGGGVMSPISRSIMDVYEHSYSDTYPELVNGRLAISVIILCLQMPQLS